jgi:hypothetical protein
MLSSRLLLAALMTAATALFVIGVSVERAQPDQHAGERAEQPRETGESHAETGGEAEEARGSTVTRDSHEEEPCILGIDPESTPLVVLATVGSLLLVAAVLRWPHAAALLALVALAMLAFAALDVREVIHQLDEDHAGVAILAAGVAILHLAAAAVATTQGAVRATGPATG